MPLIELAYQGRCEYLRAVNGVPEEPQPNLPTLPVDGLFDFLRRRAVKG